METASEWKDRIDGLNEEYNSRMEEYSRIKDAEKWDPWKDTPSTTSTAIGYGYGGPLAGTSILEDLKKDLGIKEKTLTEDRVRAIVQEELEKWLTKLLNKHT